MEGVELIELPKILDERGNLSFFENSNQIPFDIKRTYKALMNEWVNYMEHLSLEYPYLFTTALITNPFDA